MACLNERVGRVKALTDVFVEANATVVENAASAAGALPNLDRCADVGQLRAVVPPPDSPAARARVEALRHDLARVSALHDSGQCVPARVATEKLIAEADQLGYQPLVADILLSLSRSQCLAIEENLANCRRAALAGLASHHDDAAMEAATCVALMEADKAAGGAQARDWIDVATALMSRASGSHAALETWRLIGLARVYQKEGRTQLALQTLEAARALIEKTQGTEHLDYPKALNQIGVALVDLGRFEEASTYYRRAARLALDIGGPTSALATLCLINGAEALNATGRYVEAQAAVEQALAIQRRGDATAALKGYALTMLGQSLLGQDRAREAVAPLEGGLAVLRDDPTNYALVARFSLARALWADPDSRPRALALAREAKTGYQRLSDHTADVAQIAAWLREHAPARAR